jgi:epoxyqueuosine reductase
VTPEPPAQPASTLTATQVRTEAIRLGFSACAITSLEPLPHSAELDRWLASGKAGNMRYLHRQAKKRKNPQAADKTAKRVVVVLDSYYYKSSKETNNPKVARYARGTDYHTVTRRRLEILADFLRQNGAQTARAYTDSGPLAERELAQRAGLGWIGKNTMLIRPNQGSWTFIGTVLTDLELEIDPPFETDHCGSCTRCLDACPTQAFEAPRVLDATRCISYLTIEHRGPIPADLIGRFEGWAFGCDICNEVCPWNVRFATESSVPEFRPRASLDDAAPNFFDKLDEPSFAASFGDTPLQRPGLERMRRNWRAAWTSLKP